MEERMKEKMEERRTWGEKRNGGKKEWKKEGMEEKGMDERRMEEKGIEECRDGGKKE